MLHELPARRAYMIDGLAANEFVTHARWIEPSSAVASDGWIAVLPEAITVAADQTPPERAVSTIWFAVPFVM